MHFSNLQPFSEEYGRLHSDNFFVNDHCELNKFVDSPN
jgi:hypothetical protein